MWAAAACLAHSPRFRCVQRNLLMALGITNGKDKFSRTTLHLLAESLVSVRLALSTLTRRTVADKLLSFIAKNVVR